VRTAAHALTSQGLSAQGFHADVTDEAAFGELVQAVHAEHGRIDNLVNSAGVFTPADATDLAQSE